MTVCIDTNVLLQARAVGHHYGLILDGFARGNFNWLASTRIMLEYEEILSRKGGKMAWSHMILFFEAVHRRHHNLLHADPFFEFHVISDDPDDNAFTDCAITAGADYLITEDRHFAPLATAGYKPQPIAPMEFIGRYRGVYL